MTIPGEIAWSPVSSTRYRRVAADLVSLTKPRIVELLVMTGVASTVVAAGGWPGVSPLVAVAVGGGMAGAGAGSINCALEKDLDRRMPRTRDRPVADGRLSAGVAFAQGVVLNTLALLIVGALTNGLAVALTLAGSVWYVLVYTVWLKPRTPQNIVIGGLAGSFPPLVGWAAVTGTVGVTAFAFAALIFLWTPPHFWALATLAQDDYRAAGVPMLPVVAGARRTARAMLGYAYAAVAVSAVPVIAGDLSLPYLVVAVTAGTWFVSSCHQHLRRLEPSTARKVFLGSVAYLGVVFVGAVLNVLVR